MQNLYTPFLAQAYGEGPYGECSYQENDCSTSPTPPSTSTGTGSLSSGANQGGSLVNTGTAAALVIVLAVVIILAGIFVRFWRRKRSVKNPNNQPGSTGIGQ